MHANWKRSASVGVVVAVCVVTGSCARPAEVGSSSVAALQTTGATSERPQGSASQQLTTSESSASPQQSSTSGSSTTQVEDTETNRAAGSYQIKPGDFNFWQLHGAPLLSYTTPPGPTSVGELGKSVDLITLETIESVSDGDAIDPRSPGEIPRTKVTVRGTDGSGPYIFQLTRANPASIEVAQAERPTGEYLFFLNASENPGEYECSFPHLCVMAVAEGHLIAPLQDASVLDGFTDVTESATLSDVLNATGGPKGEATR